jgi:hypothetical protein
MDLFQNNFKGYIFCSSVFVEEFPCLLRNKLSLILTALHYKLQWKLSKNIQAAAYNGARTEDQMLQ